MFGMVDPIVVCEFLDRTGAGELQDLIKFCTTHTECSRKLIGMELFLKMSFDIFFDPIQIFQITGVLL